MIVNEFFYGASLSKSALDEVRIMKYGIPDRENFYVKDIVSNTKKLGIILNNKLIGKRVQFYYDVEREPNGIQTRREKMLIKQVEISKYLFNFDISFIGIPEIGNYDDITINKDFPITILPDIIRKFTTDDPYGEEDWGDENE